MALAPCRECGEEVSTEASSCPRCGVDQPVTALPLTGQAPHGGPWDDWVVWELKQGKQSPEDIAQILSEHGAHYDLAIKEVRKLRKTTPVRRRGVGLNRRKRSSFDLSGLGEFLTQISGVLGLLSILAGLGWMLYGVFLFAGGFGSGLLADTAGLWALILYFGLPGSGALTIGTLLLMPIIEGES